MSYPWTETVSEARARIMANVDNGLICPCCGLYVKRYRRNINCGMAVSLTKIYKKGGLDWVYIPDMLLRSHEEGKLAYWGLLQEANAVREDGGHAGWWRVTPKGEQFIRKGLLVPKYAIVFNKVCERLDDSEGFVNIQDCLGSKFDLRDLMK